ncbi:hypothetical protein [Parafrankia sp. FMc2]|uniref:hypothetical protein n=1 Tax=Parafrankia sp. FMc2 TaxID=3233196 RepID=UPI0034D7A30D
MVWTWLEKGHRRSLATVFGRGTGTGLAYRAPGVANLRPADRALNLPGGLHSHGLRRLVAREAARNSLDDAVAAVAWATVATVGRRRCVELARARLRLAVSGWCGG